MVRIKYKSVAYLSPKEIYFDNPLQAKRSSGLENTPQSWTP